MKKPLARQVLRPKLYEMVARAVEAGAAYGMRRAHKHTETPSQVDVIQHVVDGVMLYLCEAFDFD